MEFRHIKESAYNHWFSEVKETIKKCQQNAVLRVNGEMLHVYWELGKAISEKISYSNWSDRIISQLATDLTADLKDIHGLSVTNLKHMRRFFEFYSLKINQQDFSQLFKSSKSLATKISQQPVDQVLQIESHLLIHYLEMIPWGHHIQIFTDCKNIDEAFFYIHKTIEHSWTKAVLIHQIENNLYQDYLSNHSTIEQIIPSTKLRIAGDILRNPYSLGFLNIAEEINKKEMEVMISSNIRKFLLGLGLGFAFCGQQFHLKVGEKDYYVDLLFYHTRLHCFIAIELKVNEFDPEYAGKLQFYITAIDNQIKSIRDNPTIGLLLCKTPNKILVEYTLKYMTNGIGIVGYKHTIPKKWKNALPNEQMLRQELEKGIFRGTDPLNEKIKRMKDIVKKLKHTPANLENNISMACKISTNIQVQLIDLINTRLSEVILLFKNYKIECFYNDTRFELIKPYLNIGEKISREPNIWLLGFELTLETFIQGGAKAFNLWKKLEIHLQKHKYTIGPNIQQPWVEKVYREMLNKEEIEGLVDKFVEGIVEEVNQRAEQILAG